MSNDYELYDTISRIEFSVFTNDEIARYSAVSKDLYGITIPETDDNGEPKAGGLNDTRLGVTDQHLNCGTCGLKSMDCPGHLGHTEFIEPVFHEGFLQFVKNILSCICISCSKLLVYKNEDEIKTFIKTMSGKNRFNEIRKSSGSIEFCNRPNYGCGADIPAIMIDPKKKTTAIIQFIATYEKKSEEKPDEILKVEEKLNAERVFNILKNISDMDWLILGFNPKSYRPEDLIIKNFVIPPLAIRPSAKIESLGSVYEDTAIHKLVDIVKNANLRRKQREKRLAGNTISYEIDNQHLLQYHVATYFDNESVSLPKSEQKSGGKVYKSFSEKLKGKHGRIRGNLMGKRVEYSARSVITSDPNIALDELGCPLRVATNLTIPEVVTPDNYQKMTKLVQNGRDVYPGANYVIKASDVGLASKRYIDLKYAKNKIKLHMGDIVERHLVDGDTVLFNRQPTLQKQSMMAHKIRVINDNRYNTFRLNVSVTEPYNAD